MVTGDIIILVMMNAKMWLQWWHWESFLNWERKKAPKLWFLSRIRNLLYWTHLLLLFYLIICLLILLCRKWVNWCFSRLICGFMELLAGSWLVAWWLKMLHPWILPVHSNWWSLFPGGKIEPISLKSEHKHQRPGRMIFHRSNTNCSDFNSWCELKWGGGCCLLGCSSDNDEQLEE